MTFGFLNTLMLLGLVGVAIPLVIHLLNRRRFDTVAWGAMQFLQISQATRRRLLLEDWLLLLLRMGLVAILVLALAAPYVSSPVLADLGARPQRDVVLLFDGSYSMGFTGSGRTPHEAAQEWAAAFVESLAAGDRVTVLQAKQPVVQVVEPTHEFERVREAILHLPAPHGGCDWPQALRTAWKILVQSRQPQREIYVLSDGQRFGWADEASRLRWELVAPQLQAPLSVAPHITVVNLDPQRPPQPPNWSLAPLRAGRAIASVNQAITFHTALQVHGQQEYKPPHRLHVEVDGLAVTDLPSPTAARIDQGQVPLSFRHRFTTPGSHLVSVVVEPDLPPEQRPPGYTIRDYLPGDNRQDLAVEIVPALPVLLVDGDTRPAPRTRGTDFLRDALAPARDPTPVVRARVVPVQDFQPALLTTDLGKDPGTRPRVLVLANVARLTPEQQEAVAQFLASDGGVLVTLGERVEAEYYNATLYRAGQGWLPAHLEDLAGDETQPERAVQPLASSFFHPALDLFRDGARGGLGDARFPRWWKVTLPAPGSAAVPVALLSNRDPLLVERLDRGGRILLCTVPLDPSGRTNLTDLPAFAPWIHELVYYLAGARSVEHNLRPGQPLRYQPVRQEPPGNVVLRSPVGESRTLAVAGWPLVYEDTQEPGVYRLQTVGGQTAYYVVQPDPRESELAPCSQADRDSVAKRIPLEYEQDGELPSAARTTQVHHQELWGWLLLGVIAFLCAEVWLTRRLTIRG
ncbi:MAG: BatA and WFA domain-containing protein [Gemmataceae bacterium]|nr:BatA and WFA domain-containing protein [Gemmataceae bacterium]